MPFDLAGIVAACFLKSATMGFNMEIQTIYKKPLVTRSLGSKCYHGGY